jgi:DnaJ-class molecular chaperone
MSGGQETENRGMAPATGAMNPCRECGGEGKLTWTDTNGDVKQRTCPRCHGKRLEPGGNKGYYTK